MAHPNVVVFSTTQTDYGSTTSTATTEPPGPPATTPANNKKNDAEAVRLHTTTTISPSNQFTYQSLPSYSSSTAPKGKRFSKGPCGIHPKSRNSFVLLASHHSRMSVDTMPNSETRQIVQRLEYFVNVVNQICIGFVTIYMSWLCLRTGLAGTALHAWLVTIGFSFLMAEGIMCHYSGNVLTFNYKRTTKTTIHWVLQALGGGCGVAGCLIKLIQKGFLLQSTHGKLGFSAFVICVFSMMTGLSALCSVRVKKMISPLLNKTLHNLLGIATFVTALLAQYYGYQTGFFSRKVSTDFQTMMQIITLVALVFTCIGPLKGLYHKLRNIIRHFS